MIDCCSIVVSSVCIEMGMLMSVRRTATCVAVGLAFLAMGSAGAQATPIASIDRVMSIERRALAAGEISERDRAEILSNRTMASVLIDPTSAVEISSVTRFGRTPSATTKSKSVDKYIRYYSYTGGKTYDYHFSVSWKYNGKKIVGTPVRSHYIKSYTWFIYDRGFTSNSISVSSTRKSATITLQSLVEQCYVGSVGCVNVGNPLSKWTLKGTGKYSYSGQKG